MEEQLTSIYHFLFETFEGIVILVVGAILLSIIVCIIMEVRYKKALKEHHEALLAEQKANEERLANEDYL